MVKPILQRIPAPRPRMTYNIDIEMEDGKILSVKFSTYCQPTELTAMISDAIAKAIEKYKYNMEDKQ